MTSRMPVVLVALAIGSSGCKSENGITPRIEGSIAITQGDFDDVSEPFNRMVVAHEAYEGLISAATWDHDFDPEDNQLKVEGLFGIDQEMDGHGALFIASGTRGLGMRQYNGLADDDMFVADPDVVEQVQAYVRAGRTLVATDWAYDLVEAAWPDAIEFLGDDTVFDDAQFGADGTIDGKITDERLAGVLDLPDDVLATRFNYSYWAVMEGVGPDTTVHMTGDAEYRRRDGEGTQPIDGIPLLVSFQPEGRDGGRVVFLSFHLDAQTDAVVDELLRTVVGSFDEQASEPLEPIE